MHFNISAGNRNQLQADHVRSVAVQHCHDIVNLPRFVKTVQQVAQGIQNRTLFVNLNALRNMRMMPDNRVGAGINYAAGSVALALQRDVFVFVAPMQ